MKQNYRINLQAKGGELKAYSRASEPNKKQLFTALTSLPFIQ